MNQSNTHNDILFSIIVASYNAAGTIRNTIESILQQSCQQLEVIVIDGQSDDNTVNILKSFEDSAKLRWFSEPDNGIFDAMNKGIQISRGKYILFLGADDQLYATDVLQSVSESLQPESDIFVGNIEYSNGKAFRSSMTPLLYFVNTMHHQAIFYRREVLLENPFNPTRKICGDYEHNLFLYKNKFKIEKIEQTVSICGDDGITKQVLLSGALEEIDIRKKIFGQMLYPLNVVFVMLKFLVRKANPER